MVKRGILLALLLASVPCLAGRGPERRVTIEGRVVDETGAPVAGADVVVVESYSGEPREAETRSLRSDSEGRFCFEGAPERFYYRLFAYAPGYALGFGWAGPPTLGSISHPDLLFAPGATHATIRKSVTLRASRPIAGRVLAPDGSPVPDATVAVAMLTYATCLPPALREALTVRTDANGIYRLSGLPMAARSPNGVLESPPLLEVSAPPYAVHRFQCLASPPDVRLQPGYRLRGRLVAGGVGIPGRTIAAGRNLQRACDGYEPPDGEATTDRQGRFEIPGLPAGTYEVLPRYTRDGDWKVPLAPVTLGAETPEAEVTLAATPGGFVKGTAVDPATGEPLSCISLYCVGPEHAKGHGTAAYTREGRFRVHVAPGQVRIWVASCPPGKTDTGYAAEVTVPEEGEVEVAVPVANWRCVAGHVYRPDGTPAAGVWVRTRRQDDWRDDRTRTLPDGSFRFAGQFPPGEMTLDIDPLKDGTGLVAPIRVDVRTRADVRLDLVPLPQVALVGRVLDDRGRPVANHPVELLHRAPGAPRDESFPPRTKTGADGTYHFVVRALTGEFRARASGGVLTATGPLWVPHGPARLLGDNGPERRFADIVAVPFGARIAGRVLGASGKPAGGVAVFWPSGTSPEHTAETNARGRFEIRRLPDRPVLLVAQDDERGCAFVRAAPGKEVEMVLGRGE